MRIRCLLLPGVFSLFLSCSVCNAEIRIEVDHNQNERASGTFKFNRVPSPSKTDSASKAKFKIVDGKRDPNGGELEKLHDGGLPDDKDQPEENFFFDAGTAGGRLQVDLDSVIEIKQINTYSWHTSTRAPQVYKLYATDGTGAEFKPEPKQGADPEKCGWKLIASVDTRPTSGDGGGQYGVSISDTQGLVGKYRYLLFDISRTETRDNWGNTLYSEIDVIAKDDALAAAEVPAASSYVLHSVDNYCQITIDTSSAPELSSWATNKLAPVLAEWYPKIVAMLPSEGYSAPTALQVIIKPGRGVAGTRGTEVTANSRWLTQELHGEAIGALLHEEVHVIQAYGTGPPHLNNGGHTQPPGWLVEGIPDYIRWFRYEPQSHGADVTWIRRQGNLSLSYDAGYRITANFLNYAVQKYGADLITKLNADCRQWKYSDDLWISYTGKTLPHLNQQWRKAVAEEIAEAGRETVR